MQLQRDEERRALAELPPEAPLGHDSQGRPLFSYRELLRRNIVKGDWLDPALHAGLSQACLEQFLVDNEFEVRFGMSKDEFSRVPKWKRDEQKKKAGLF
jgi:hypothetical protein